MALQAMRRQKDWHLQQFANQCALCGKLPKKQSIEEGVAGGLTTRSGRKEESYRGKHNRIGRGVKKTNTIVAEKRITRSMAFGFLRGRVRFANASPSPRCGIQKKRD